MNELVTIENNIPLADSRVVAKNLGVQHGDFFSNIIKKFQREVEEDFGIIRFKNGEIKGRGQPEKYALLTEEQTNTYMSYSRNTEQARVCKRKLVKAFSDAKRIIAQLINERQQHSSIPFNESVQRRCIANEKLLPSGCWCVVNEMYKEALIVVAFQKELKDWALPDGSCGKKWRNHCKSAGIDLSRSFKHALWVPNLNGPTGVWIYPIDGLLEKFRPWLRIEYADYYENSYSPSRLVESQQIGASKRRIN